MSQGKKKNSRSRNWCFTDFELLNWKKIYEDYHDIIRYICWGKEECPKTKKIHYQGWIQFVNVKRMSRVKSIVGSKKLHVEMCRGTEQQNEKYCQKDNKYTTLGQFKIQGQRTDLEEIHKEIKSGKKIGDIIESHFETFCRYRNGIKDGIQYYTKKNNKKFRNVHVEYYHGETGTGKTRLAMENNPDAFKITGDNLKWFDGYDGEKTLIIDEYANQCSVTKLLNLLDGYQLRLAVKGGFTYASWEKVIITSNLTPEELHFNAKDAHRQALFRRIDEITKFTC